MYVLFFSGFDFLSDPLSSLYLGFLYKSYIIINIWKEDTFTCGQGAVAIHTLGHISFAIYMGRLGGYRHSFVSIVMCYLVSSRGWETVYGE